MIQQTLNDVVTPELVQGAIINNEFPGFPDDYRVLHCLIRKYSLASFFEVGTNFGTGTKIIKNAMGVGIVYSLDLPFGEGDVPLYAKGKDHTGENCSLPFVQLRGDSMTFDFSRYPCQGYFIDAGHFYDNVLKETTEILKLKPKLIVWHDADIPEVYKAIHDSFEGNYEYNIFRVVGTRIAYATIRTW